MRLPTGKALGKDHLTRGKAGQAVLIFLGVWLVSQKPKAAKVPAVAAETVPD